ncbi:MULTISPECIES: hypothetical protein [Cyanophyceae]|nr:hypothetical protein [Trichocoleus sp. FACHB-69]
MSHELPLDTPELQTDIRILDAIAFSPTSPDKRDRTLPTKHH